MASEAPWLRDLLGVYAGDWARDAVASIQAWDMDEAHRLLPVLARRLGKSNSLREMFATYSGKERLGEAIRKIHVPALVLWGEQDTIFPVRTPHSTF